MDRFHKTAHAVPRRRAIALALFLVFVFGGYSLRLFQIQMVDGDEYAEIVRMRSHIRVPIVAARGEILDRHMNPLAINRTSFSLVLDAAFFPRGKDKDSQKEQNDIILSLTELLTAAGGEWNDTLPISKTAPYAFEEERESSIAYLKSDKMLRMADYATAEQCMDELVRYYSLKDYNSAQQRTIAGVRYEIDFRQLTISNPFVFSNNVPEDAYTILLENSSRFPGVNIQTAPIREYVSGRVGAHLLGTVGPIYAEEYQKLKDKGYLLSDTVGKSGIEAAVESDLRGINGVSTVVKEASGGVVEKQETSSPVPGSSVILTLDYTLQKAAQEALDDMVTELRSQPKGRAGQDIRSGSVVVLDMTGGVLVSASWPDFDLSSYNADYAKLLKDSDKPLFNRALNGAFACGSTMKPGVALAGLAEGLITRTSSPVSCSGKYHFYASSGYAPTCMGRHGSVGVVNALAQSCNVFFYDLGRRLTIQTMNQYSALFGLGQKTGIEIGEATGVLAGPEYSKSIGRTWNPGDTIQSAIGQSDNLFTPIQLAAYAMTIANEGVRYKTHLVKSVLSYEGVEKETKPEVLATVKLSKEAMESVRQGMIDCTKPPRGTARGAFGNAPYSVAAKTGTAQIAENRSDHGVFIAFAPAENPEVAISVVLENGTSGPSTRVARAVLDAYFEAKDKGTAPAPEGELLP